jgi:hypothetical protein
METASQMTELLTPVVGAVRAELGLPFDALVYSKLAKEAQAKGKQEVLAFMKAIKGIADDHDNSSDVVKTDTPA